MVSLLYAISCTGNSAHSYNNWHVYLKCPSSCYSSSYLLCKVIFQFNQFINNSTVAFVDHFMIILTPNFGLNIHQQQHQFLILSDLENVSQYFLKQHYVKQAKIFKAM